MSSSRKRTGVHSLLFQRELTGRRRTNLLLWSRELMYGSGRSASYIPLPETAKSTIALAFSADGEYFASTHGDHTVKVFRCATWTVECVLTGHERTPWTVKFHPHNNRLLASGSLDQTVRIWDVSTKQCLCRHHFDFVVSCIAFHSSGELLAVAAGKRILLWRWQQREPRQALTGAEPPLLSGRMSSTGGAGGWAARLLPGVLRPATAPTPAQVAEEGGAARRPSPPQSEPPEVLVDGQNAQRCVAFKRSSSHELLFVAETNSETPPVPPPLPHANPANSNAPPFTVQLLMWMLPPEAAAAERSSGLQLRPDGAALRVGLSVMYSDAGFDVSRCGRYLALCELDPAVGYHLRVFSLEKPTLGSHLQTVTLPNCPFVTSVQFCPLTLAVLIGYGRCQVTAPEAQPGSQYAVLRCIKFDAGLGGERSQTSQVELFAVSSMDESNVALFHPHPTSAAWLGFLYATKDGRIRAFRFGRPEPAPAITLR